MSDRDDDVPTVDEVPPVAMAVNSVERADGERGGDGRQARA
jgi:hypothetical protein